MPENKAKQEINGDFSVITELLLLWLAGGGGEGGGYDASNHSQLHVNFLNECNWDGKKNTNQDNVITILSFG